MNTRTLDPRVFDFNFPDHDTLIRVEDRDDLITIRATRDTFNRSARERFIHHLAAEGFIPDEFQWFAFDQGTIARPLCWVIDYSWLELDAGDTARARHFMLRLIGSAVVLWLVLISSFILRPGG